MRLTAQYPILPGVAWSISVLFACLLLVGLLIVVYRDLFGRKDLSRPARAAWVVATLALPFVGAFGYLLTHGRGLVVRHRHLEIGRTRVDYLLHPPGRGSLSGAAHRAMQAATARWLLRTGAVTRIEYDQLTRQDDLSPHAANGVFPCDDRSGADSPYEKGPSGDGSSPDRPDGEDHPVGSTAGPVQRAPGPHR